jgi:hypothetical protein
MSSTLFVDAIEPNLSSGVHIPGHVVQHINVNMISAVAITSASNFVEILAGTITTKFANSLILVQAVLPSWSSNPNANVWTNSAYVILNENSSLVAAYEHPGPQNSMEFSQVVPILYSSPAKAVGTYTYSIQCKNTTAGDTITYGRSSYWTRLIIQEIAQ